MSSPDEEKADECIFIYCFFFFFFCFIYLCGKKVCIRCHDEHAEVKGQFWESFLLSHCEL